MPNIWEVIAKLKELRKKKERSRNKRRIDDLFIKFYEYNDQIRLPIPNLFANAQIQAHFGGEENIDFEKDEHIGWLLFILRNQENDRLTVLSPKEQEAEVHKILQEIPLHQKEQYQKALFELFAALKKNSIRRQKEIMLQVLDILSH